MTCVHVYFQNSVYGVDAKEIEYSNWARWVNCARTPEELNVRIGICNGKVYYFLRKDVRPGEELFAYYGAGYGLRLGVDVLAFEKFLNQSLF